MRQFFEPAEAPLWLKRVLFSIRDGLSDVWATALRLKDYATASLPPAADWKQGLVYDSTLNAVKFSDGSNWTDLSAAGHTHTEADIQLSATNVIVGRATAGAGAAEEITCTAAGRALLDDADASAQRTTLGLGTAAVKNTGTSGNTVPLLDGAAATWTNGANFGGNVAVTGNLSCTANATLGNTSAYTHSVSGNFLLNSGLRVQGSVPSRNSNGLEFGYNDSTGVGAVSIVSAASGWHGTFSLGSLSGTNITVNGGTIVSVTATGMDVNGEVRGDSLRIDAAPTASSDTVTHKLAVNLNGTTYYLLLSNV